MSDAEANERRRDEPRHTLRYVARSDRGLVRANNQDSVFAGNRLLVIADGMGGHAAGDTASRLVVAAFAPLNERHPAPDLLSDLVGATREGNDAIAEMVAENPELDGMGTTVTAMLFDGDRVGMAHVGDSRAYLYRSGVLHQLTHDDTFVQSLIDDGRITEQDAQSHPQRNLLLRALNGTDLDPFLALREVRAGDRYLLCSDGLSGVVGAESIADALADPDPERAADVLIQRALLRGGPDNVTVIVADVMDTGVLPAAAPATAPGGQADDPDATGPIQQLTREMPRVPLPPIPEEPAAPPEFVESDQDDGFPDEEDDEDGEDGDDGVDVGAGPEGGDGDGGPDPARNSHARGDGARERHRRWRRRGALTVAIVALLLVAMAGSTLWVRNQYYVGASGDTVAVFQGVDGSLLGFRFSSFQENSCAGRSGCTPIKVSDLQPAARNKVLSGILATSLTDARSVMQRLSGQLLPPCPDPVATSSGTPPTTGTAPTTTGTTGTTDRGTPRGTAGAPGAPGSTGTATGDAGSHPASPAPGTPSATSSRRHAGTPTTTAQQGAPQQGHGSTRTTADTSAATVAGAAGHAGDADAGRTREPAGPPAGHSTTGRTAGGTPGVPIAGHGPVTVAPPPTTLTVQVTVTPSPGGLLAGAVNRALLAPSTRTATPTTAATKATAGTRTAATRTGGTAGHATKATGRSHRTAPVSTVTADTPTVTVTHTVTATPSATATPLAPAPAVPGVTCRADG